MNSIYNIVAPQIGVPNTAATASYLLGNAVTKNISSMDGGNLQFNNNINVNYIYGTASWAANLTSLNYTITSSWSNNSLFSNVSNAANYLNYQGVNNGTASYAIISLSSSAGNNGPNFISTPSILPGSTSNTNWITINLSGYGVSPNAKAAILETFYNTGQGPIFMTFRTNASASAILTSSAGALGSADTIYLINQITIPTSGSFFDYQITGGGSGQTYIKILGYY